MNSENALTNLRKSSPETLTQPNLAQASFGEGYLKSHTFFQGEIITKYWRYNQFSKRRYSVFSSPNQCYEINIALIKRVDWF